MGLSRGLCWMSWEDCLGFFLLGFVGLWGGLGGYNVCGYVGFAFLLGRGSVCESYRFVWCGEAGQVFGCISRYFLKWFLQSRLGVIAESLATGVSIQIKFSSSLRSSCFIHIDPNWSMESSFRFGFPEAFGRKLLQSD